MEEYKTLLDSTKRENKNVEDNKDELDMFVSEKENV